MPVHPSNKIRKKRKRDLISRIKHEIGCNDCPERNPVCLDFHHIYPKNKEEGIAKMISDNTSLKRILLEIAKCEILCANCHRKKHKKS